MQVSKIGLNQLKFNKGNKIYTKGDKAHFAAALVGEWYTVNMHLI